MNSPDSAEILRLRAASNAAIAAHDAAGIVACVEDEVCVTTGNGQVCIGREAMRARFAEMFARQPDILYVRTPHSVELSEAAPLACEQGVWRGSWSEDGRPVQVDGRYTAMWRRGGQGWRIRSELYVLLERNA